MLEKGKELSKEELERLLQESREAFLAKGNQVKLYAADSGRTKLKPGEYEKTRRRQKDNYGVWVDSLKEGGEQESSS